MLEKIKKHLLLLDDHLNKLKAEKNISKKNYLKDYKLQAIVERFLHLVIEDCISIGNMIISQEGFKKPETYGDIFIELASRNIISKKSKEEFTKIVRFRNMLVHIYWEIDHKLVYEILQAHLKDFDAFIKEIKKYIQNKNRRKK